MAVTFVGASHQAERSFDDTITIQKPSGVLQGDIMITVVCNFDKRPGAPNGWTRIQDNGGNADINASIWYKVAGASEPNNYTWEAGTSYGDITWAIATVAYRGVDTSNPIHKKNQNDSGTAESLSTGSITTTSTAMLVYYSCDKQGDSPTSSCTTNQSSPHVERKDVGHSNTDSFFSRNVAIYDSGVQEAAGAKSATLTRTGSVSHHGTGIIALLAAEEEEEPNTDDGELDSNIPDYPVSQRFLDALKGSHTVFSYVDVVSPTNETVRLAAIGGSIEVDRTAEVRRRCTVEAIDITGELTPAQAGDILSPYGTEIYPYRGVKFSDGTVEVVPLGIFRISKVSIKDESPGIKISIEAYDRSRTIARDKFTSPYTIEQSTNIMDALKSIAGRTFVELPYITISTPRVVETTRVYDIGDDPWQAITELATSIGCDVFFDVQGRLTVIPPPNIDSLPSPRFTYIEGQNCTLLSLEKILTDEPGFNGVVVIGESPGDELPPVRGVAWDDEPSSATYRLGPYGEVPMFHQDQLVKTEQEAVDLANMLLQNQLGFSSQLSISAIANPLLECGDVIQVRRAKSKVDDLYVVDAFGIPFNASGTQDLTLRQKRTVG